MNPLARFVKEELRAWLKSGSLVIGQLYVDLDFFEDEPAAEVRTRNGYSVIPSVTATPGRDN